MALIACADEAPGGADSQPPAGLQQPTGDPATVPLGGRCDHAERLGGFVVEVYDAYSIAAGQALEGVVPSSLLTELEREGDCALVRRDAPFCDPPCAAGDTCDHDGECVPYPASLDLGRATIAGLAADVIMDPVEPGYSYYDTALPHPAFEAGALAWLQTGGGAFDPLSLYAVGVEPLALGASSWLVAGGAPVEVTWGPPADGARSRILISLNVDQHGTSPASVTCDLPDTGSATIPASMIDGLIGAGVSGYPSATVRRETADRADVDGGCLDFSLASPRGVEIDVEGFTPCVSDTDCPPGQSCDLDLQICE